VSPHAHATDVLTAFAADGTRLTVYLDAPARPRPGSATVVLVHGASVTADLWRAHTRRLTALGLRVLRYDQRAHGHSPRGDAPLTVEQLADDLHHVLRACAPSGPLVLAGHSLGALVVQEAAALRPTLLSRTRGMVLVSTTAQAASVLPGHSPHALLLAAGRGMASLAFAHTPSLVDRGRRLLPATHRYALTSRPDTRERNQEGPPRCRHGVRHTPTADLYALWQALHTYQPSDLGALKQLGERLLLMAGAKDRHIPAAQTEHMAKLLPDARLEILPEATHALPVRHPDLISAHIARLSEHPASGRPVESLLPAGRGASSTQR
jgi:pimeloyl-ACP methyl ester carboxylesterase